MEENQTPPKNSLRFIRRPEIGVAVGVLGNFLTWWFSTSVVDPTYWAFPAETVARRESPRLAVTWDGVPIENLCVSRVALWNAGRQPITQDKLPTPDPLRIVPTQTVRILAVELANSSRPTLTLDTQIVKSKEADHVQLSIHGGDAMEKGEGVAVRLLFTGDCQSDFRVAGRVIGSSGFRPNEGRPEKIVIVFLTVLAFLGALFMVRAVPRIEQYLINRFPRRLGQLVDPYLGFVLYLIVVSIFGVVYWTAIGPAPSWLPPAPAPPVMPGGAGN